MTEAGSARGTPEMTKLIASYSLDMRASDFWEKTDELFDPDTLNSSLLEAVRRGPLSAVPDIELAVALARFAHNEYEAFGTSGSTLSNEDSALVLATLRSVLLRLGISSFDPPFRHFDSFNKYWKQNGGYGSWQARRDMLESEFEPLHLLLEEREAGSITSTLAEPISPHRLTGWPRVDEELMELRRHFESATTQQDYSNVGNDAVSVLEALSAAVYEHEKHRRNSEEPEPPVASTKDRLDRYVEVHLPGKENAEMRKLTRATIEMAQSVKHRRATVTRTAAGVAADAVILLCNLLRRIASAVQ